LNNEQSHTGPEDAEEHDRSGVPDGDGMVCVLCSNTYPTGTRYCPVDGSRLRAPVKADDELLGTVIDERYYLVSKLGEGGMGQVYLAEHVRTHRRCAVKVIGRLQTSDPAALGRFLREATNAGRISHPHVATVYDYGEAANGMAYLAMEYVDGEPLSKILAREGPLSPARAVEIARQVAEGVAAAHELGIVHRDLKPGNILVARDRRGGDRVKVVDFGIARAPAEKEQSLTRTGTVLGTPEYMSPEQLIGDPVDGRSDVYALGCILYQMLTGTPAFGSVTAQVITRRLTEPPPHARERNPAIPKALDDLIVTALGRLPTERFQTMESMRDALMEAPSQPVVTGPRRLASWLGLRTGSPRDAAPDSGLKQPRSAATHPQSGPLSRPDSAIPSGELSAPPSGEQFAPAAGEQSAPAAGEQSAPPAVPQSAPPAVPQSAPPAVPQSGPHYVAGAVTNPSASFVVGEPALAEVDAGGGDDPGPSGRKSRRTLVLAGTAGVVLLAVAAALLAGDREDLPESATPQVAAPEPAPVLEDSVVRNLWRELQTASSEGDSGEYDTALRRLAGTRPHVASLRLTFPQHAELAVAADSSDRLTDRLLSACNQLRASMLARGREAPECVPPQD
jgi:eukaryotic-like serine/threonine-protein kinase